MPNTQGGFPCLSGYSGSPQGVVPYQQLLVSPQATGQFAGPPVEQFVCTAQG